MIEKWTIFTVKFGIVACYSISPLKKHREVVPPPKRVRSVSDSSEASDEDCGDPNQEALISSLQKKQG